MTIYSDKLAHLLTGRYQLPISAQMCTREDALAYILGLPFIDDVMS